VNSDDHSSGELLILGMPVVVVVLVWLITAVIAGIVAPSDRRGTFFVLTLLLFGPVGIALALIAQPRATASPRPLAPGRIRYVCPCCGADADLVPSTTDYQCWRCGEQHRVDHRPALEETGSPKTFSKEWWWNVLIYHRPGGAPHVVRDVREWLNEDRGGDR
jgi:DNA-directed RNA polymerase subunit RPC12/RpoP